MIPNTAFGPVDGSTSTDLAPTHYTIIEMPHSIVYSDPFFVGTGFRAICPIVQNYMDIRSLTGIPVWRYGSTRDQNSLLVADNNKSTCAGLLYASVTVTTPGAVVLGHVDLVGCYWTDNPKEKLLNMKMPHQTPSFVGCFGYDFEYTVATNWTTISPTRLCLFNGSVVGIPPMDRFSAAYWEGSGTSCGAVMDAALQLAIDRKEPSLLSIDLPSTLDVTTGLTPQLHVIHDTQVTYCGVTRLLSSTENANLIAIGMGQYSY